MTTTSDVIKLPGVVLSFPEVFQPKAFQPGQQPKYQATFLMDPSNAAHAKLIKSLQAACMEILEQHYGKGKVPKGVKMCLKDNDKEEKEYAGYEGMWFLSSSNSVRPTVVRGDLSPVVEEDGVIYPGCVVNATITLWVQDNQYGKRVNANLRAIQFVRDGERLGGIAPAVADHEFDVVEDGAEGAAETADEDSPW